MKSISIFYRMALASLQENAPAMNYKSNGASKYQNKIHYKLQTPRKRTSRTKKQFHRISKRRTK